MTDTKRSGDQLLVELLQMVTETHGILKSHMHDHDLNHQALEGKLDIVHNEVLFVRSGFPDDNPPAHRETHTEYARRLKEKADFWRKLTFELSKYGLICFIGWACYSLWNAFLQGPGK